MVDKIKSLLGSLRFWVVTFAWLSDYLSKVSSEGFDLTILMSQIAMWLGTVVAIGTADSVVTKFGASVKHK